VVVSSRDETATHDRLVTRRHNCNCFVATLYSLWPCHLDLWPFDLIFIAGRGIVLDYPCAKLWSLYFHPFWFYCLTYYVFAFLWPFELIFVCGQGIVMCHCKVWTFWFRPFWFYRADRETDRITVDTVPIHEYLNYGSLSVLLRFSCPRIHP